MEAQPLILPFYDDTPYSTLSAIDIVCAFAEQSLRDGYTGDCWETLESAVKRVRQVLTDVGYMD